MNLDKILKGLTLDADSVYPTFLVDYRYEYQEYTTVCYGIEELHNELKQLSKLNGQFGGARVMSIRVELKYKVDSPTLFENVQDDRYIRPIINPVNNDKIECHNIRNCPNYLVKCSNCVYNLKVSVGSKIQNHLGEKEEDLKLYEIWSPPYTIQDLKVPPRLLGKFYGKTFEDACRRFVENNAEFKKYYNAETNEYWGMKLWSRSVDYHE